MQNWVGKGTRGRERQTERDSNAERDKDKQARDIGRTRKTKNFSRNILIQRQKPNKTF